MTVVGAAPREAPRRLSFLTKLSYGSGQGIDAVIQAAVSTFLLFYLTAVCGMSGAAAGAMFLISLMIDGLLDPYIGRLSDQWRSRWGRRIPFMVVALPLLMISVALLFALPVGLTGTALFGYVLFLNIVLRVSLSVFALPHSAVTAELTNDYAERSVLSTFRALFIVVGFAAAVVPAFSLIFGGQDGLQVRSAYPHLGLWLAIVIGVFGLWCLLGSGRAIIRLPVPQGTDVETGKGFLSEVMQLFRNPSFVPLFVGAVLVLVAEGAIATLALHAYRYVWRLPTALIQAPLLVVPIGMLIGTIAAAVLVRRIEKRDVVVAAIAVIAVYSTAITLLVLAGVVAPGSMVSVTLLILYGLLFGGCGALCFVCFASMIADAVDEHDFLFGVRREALYAAALMIGAKAASGLGAFIAGVGLELIHFSIPAAGGESVIPAATVTGLAILWGPVGGLLLVLALPFLLRYRIDRAHHARVLEGLAARHVVAG